MQVQITGIKKLRQDPGLWTQLGAGAPLTSDILGLDCRAWASELVSGFCLLIYCLTQSLWTSVSSSRWLWPGPRWGLGTIRCCVNRQPLVRIALTLSRLSNRRTSWGHRAAHECLGHLSPENTLSSSQEEIAVLAPADVRGTSETPPNIHRSAASLLSHLPRQTLGAQGGQREEDPSPSACESRVEDWVVASASLCPLARPGV